jgi:hypothetical protein
MRNKTVQIVLSELEISQETILPPWGWIKDLVQWGLERVNV